jgi:hypothetical protein
MAQINERRRSTDSIEWSFDRETLGTLLVRHPWAVRFLAFEALLLALAGVVPLLGASAFHSVAFGMLLALAALGAVVAVAVGTVLAAGNLRRSTRDGTLSALE